MLTDIIPDVKDENSFTASILRLNNIMVFSQRYPETKDSFANSGVDLHRKIM